MIFIKTFITKYFLLDIKDYLPVDFSFRINEILLFLFVGIALACFAFEWMNGIRYRGVRALLRHDATSEEKAKTPKELGIAAQRSVLRALSEGGSLERLVSVVGKKKPTYEEYIAAEREKKRSKKRSEQEDVLQQRFYLSSDSVERARHIYEKSAPSLLHALFLLPLLLALYVAVALLMPSLLQVIASLTAG